MKTIFIPIAARQQARNVLRTDILKSLSRQKDVRIVVFAPRYKIPLYREGLQADNVIFEGVDDFSKSISFADRIFKRLSLFYIDSGTARYFKKHFLFYERRAFVRYFFSLALLTILGNAKVLQAFCRFADSHLVKDNRLSYYFDAYAPDIVFSPNIVSALDQSFLRHAKHREIETIGMINAWDNITIAKYPFRLIPDRIIAYNEIIKREVTRYLHVSGERVVLSGMPHFDYYLTSKRSSREAFCKRVGIPPDKRILLFAAIGTPNSTEEQVAVLLADSIENGKLPRDIVILFRYHPTQRGRTAQASESKHIIFDDSKTFFESDSNQFSEILLSDTAHLANSLYHADILITSASTMCIDASVFDTPVIDIAFDGWEERPFHDSIRFSYTEHCTHYYNVVQTGGTRIAYSLDELITSVREYLSNPEQDRERRQRILREQCYMLDGKSGERIARFILSELDINPNR